MPRSQRHLRHQRGFDSSGVTAYEEDEPSRVSVANQHAGSDAVGGTPAPANTVAPSISGTPTVGETLTLASGTWLGSPSYARQWYRDGVAISAATGSTYVLVEADEDALISATVVGSNANGSELASAAAVGPVAAA